MYLSVAEGWGIGFRDARLIPANRNCPVVRAIFFDQSLIKSRYRNLQSTYFGFFVLRFNIKQFYKILNDFFRKLIISILVKFGHFADYGK